jgi:acyl dehydratase
MSILNEIQSFRAYFETLNEGDKFTSPARTITETDIVNFAALSGDYNALHTDAAYAATTAHGQRIAHGLLVLAVTSGLSTRLPIMKAMESTIIGLAELRCRWRRPTFIGDTVHVVLEVVSKAASRKPDRGAVTLRRTTVNQNDKTVMESDWSLVVKRETPAA